jgi:hypothetical protein
MRVERNILLTVSASWVVAGALAIPVFVFAQGVPPHYKASPDVYKVISENDKFSRDRGNMETG